MMREGRPVSGLPVSFQQEHVMNARTMLGVLVTAVVCLALGYWIQPAAAVPEKSTAEGQVKLIGLYAEKAKAAKDYHESVNAAYENGTVAFTEAAAASKELFDAELQVAVTPRQRLDVCKSYADREAAMLRKVEQLSTSRSKGGEREKHDLARLSLAKAKIVLAQERQKKAG